MRIISKEHIIEELQERVAYLERENNALSEHVEETILFNFISESFDSISNSKELIEALLEKISILKGVPLCYCIDFRPRSHKVLGNYCAYDSGSNLCIELMFSNDLRKRINNEGVVRIDCRQTKGNILNPTFNAKFKPYEAVIVPFSNHHIEHGLFIFITDEESQNAFGNDLFIFHQFVKIVSDKWERLGLINELKKLNASLEKRVKKRTSELTRINELLFNEIQINQSTNVELRVEKEKFHQLFNMANDAIYLWEIDKMGNIKRCLEANQAAVNMTGYSHKELKGMTPKDLMSKEFKDKEKSILKQLDIKKSNQFEVVHQRKDGTVFPVEISAHQFFLNKKSVVLSITRDITERKRIENDLIEAKEKAEEADRLKSSFLANMSHEIRTPMNAISGFAELLKDDDLMISEVKDFASIILSNSNHLLNLINDLVDFSKIEAGYIKPNIGACNISTLLKNLQLNIQSLLYNHHKENIEVNFDIPDFLAEHPVLTDEVKLRQILSNLLTNSVKFTKKGSISLQVDLFDDEILQFLIVDTGIGIPPKYHQKIFDRFVQVKDKKTFNIPGTGLGLAICQNLAEMLDGQVQLLNSSAKGTTFSCKIPYRLVKVNS